MHDCQGSSHESESLEANPEKQSFLAHASNTANTFEGFSYLLKKLPRLGTNTVEEARQYAILGITARNDTIIKT